MDDWLLNRKDGEHFDMICTQPRKISAIGVSERVASERAERIGETVGYQVSIPSVRTHPFEFITSSNLYLATSTPSVSKV